MSITQTLEPLPTVPAKSSASERPVIAITLGDHQGIGPEIVAKALTGPALLRRCVPVVLGDRALVLEAFARWSNKAFRRRVRFLETGTQLSSEALHDLLPDSAGRSLSPIFLWDPLPIAPAEEARLPEQTYIREAVSGCLTGIFDAMTTAPICKESMLERGFSWPGHTEYLGALTGVERVVMGFVSPKLRVSLATVHIPLSEVPRRLTPEGLLQVLAISDRALRTWFRVPSPRLAVCGLNPHAGEHGRIGTEEQTWIQACLEQARATGIKAEGPFPADTVFVRAARGDFDLVVALYHDQGLIPVKLLGFGRSVNVTLGLPIIRTSVDHGVASDIAGRGLADASSMRSALKLAIDLVQSHSSRS